MAWVNVPNLFSTINTIIPMHCGNSPVNIWQPAEEVFPCRDLLYTAGDLCGVVDVGLAVRRGLNWKILT